MPVLAQCAPGGVRSNLITEFASDMISVHALDDAATYLYVSPAATRLFGYDANDLLGHSAYAFIHPADRETVTGYASLMRSTPDVVTVRYRLLLKRGGSEWVESTARVVSDPVSGTPTEVVATTRSIAARVASEAEQERLLAETRRAREAAEQANRTKDDFLAMMSHEFRTPLNAIAGHLQLLQMGIHGALTTAQHLALERIDLAQHHLLRLVNDILNVERLRAGRLDYDVRPVRVAELVRELDPMIEPQLREKSLTYRVDVADTELVLADREKLLQVLINLISNAIKFTPQNGTITLDGPRRHDGSQQMDVSYLRVRDTGVGIPAEKQGAVFEPFVQVNVSPAGRASGAGLGLAISRDLARGMGGELRVRSTLGLGASFTVTLPRATPPPLNDDTL